MHSIVLLVLGIASILARSCTSVDVLISDRPLNEYCHSVSLRSLMLPAQPDAPAFGVPPQSSLLSVSAAPLGQSGCAGDHRQHRSVDPIVLSTNDSANLPMRQNPAPGKIDSCPGPNVGRLGND